MIIRTDGDDASLISQPAHAWLSGQLARAWGNDHVGSVEPFEELCLAAEQHDIGWLDWESHPTLNPETWLPHSFRTLGKDVHIEMWSRAGRLALAYGRYPALFVSLHGTGLYERFGIGPDASTRVQDQVEEYLASEREFQRELVASLERDVAFRDFVVPEVIENNQRLIAFWDGISLVLCGGVSEPTKMGDYQLSPVAGESVRVSIDPWPFWSDEVSLSVDARILTERFADQDAMHRALETAEWTLIRFVLVPAV